MYRSVTASLLPVNPTPSRPLPQSRELGLELTNGDPLGYFRVSRINDSCWTLLLVKELDADQRNPDGTQGQEFSLAMRVSDGNVLTFVNLDVQVGEELKLWRRIG